MLTVLVALTAVALVGLRPFRLPEWLWPVAGALVVVAAGTESPRGAYDAIAGQWNVLLFILGLMAIAAAAEIGGAFAWITEILLQRARGSRRRLFVTMFLAGAALTLLFSNDATAIVLTPIVYRSVAAWGDDAMPYLYACAFVANTASFGFPFSNPANILILPHPHAASYLAHLAVPQVLAIAVNLAIFLFFFRDRLRGTFEHRPATADRARATRTLAAMGVVGLGYAVALPLGWPLGIVAAAGGALCLLAAQASARETIRHVSFGTFALLAGLFVLVDAVARAGVFAWALHGIADAAGYGRVALDAVAASGSALVSNALNNLPVAVASAYVVTADPQQHVAYPLIVGVDLGPNLTIGGSLAGLLWAAALRRRGVVVRRRDYLRLGAVVVPATIAVAIAWLAIAGMRP